MWPYWLMFLIPAWATLLPARLKPGQSSGMWVFVGVIFSVMIGVRYQVGGDWGQYGRLFADVGRLDFIGSLSRGDPGYYGFGWLIAQAGGGISILNLVCAAVMMWGTVTFCRSQPNPWLALLVAVPYMLVVVGMGYSRQAVALGFALLGLVALGKGRIRTFVIWVAIGATFHKSAVLLLPIAALASSRNRFQTSVLVGMTTLLLYYLLLRDSSEALWQNYVDAGYQSEGGFIRVVMNALPALLLIWFRKRLVPDKKEQKLWLWIAAFCLMCLPMVALASTAVDRVALYLIPIQLFVFARIPRLAMTVTARTQVVVAIVGYYGAVFFVWLNFATNAIYWLPYKFVPLW
jgi:hypothetical protein